VRPALDDVFIQRLWCRLTYESSHLYNFDYVATLLDELNAYIR
jgi:hypothetical protein